jgi:hypothetical protein
MRLADLYSSALQNYPVECRTKTTLLAYESEHGADALVLLIKRLQIATNNKNIETPIQVRSA